MIRKGWLLILSVFLLGAIATAVSAKLAWDSKEFMGVDEVTPGMVGYGKTVYQGTKIEKFDVEVIGVLQKVDFGFDMILIKVTSGPLIDRKLQSVSGMSGSPIYIDDRIIGAYAYSWDFGQEAIAGVTPIASMLECTEPGSAVPPLAGNLVPKNRVLQVAGNMITRVQVSATAEDAAKLQAKVDPTTLVLTPAATPLFVSGMPDSAIKPLQRFFDRYNMRALPGPGVMEGVAPPLEPGSSVAVSLMEGDANFSGVGTVTYVKGNTVLAFGHPFFGLGTIDLPMSTAYVHGIVSSSMASFKLASPMKRIGTVVSDRAFAIGGTVGQKPNTLPVSLFLADQSRNFTRRYQVDMINDDDFTPFLLYLYVLYGGSMQMADLLWDEGTFTGRTVISTDKYGDIEQNMVASPRESEFFMPMGEFWFLADSLMMNPYEPVKLNKVFIDLKYTPGRNTATIEKAIPDRLVARPGDTVNFDVKIRPYGKPIETKRISVKVPERGVEPAMVTLIAGGTLNYLLKSFLEPSPTPEEGVKGIIRWLTNNPGSNTMLTTQLFPSPSFGYQGHMLRDLPLSTLDVLRIAEFGGTADRGAEESEGAQARISMRGVYPTSYQAVEEMPYVLTGGQGIMIAIDTDERAVQSWDGKFDFGLGMPVLSTSLTPGGDGGAREGAEEGKSIYAAMSWFTPQQRARHAMIFDSLALPSSKAAPLALPTFTAPVEHAVQPLSYELSGARGKAGEMPVEAEPAPGAATNADNAAGDEEVADEEGEDEDAGENDGADAAPPTVTADSSLLTKKRMSWGLTGRRDFLRGRHLGTSVTSKGRLVLAPTVRALFQTPEMIPTELVSTANDTYVAGWGSPKVVRIATDGKGAVIFPKSDKDAPGAEAVSALATDEDGNLLIATWPDQCVRLVLADGTVMRTWRLPGAAIWDVAVGTDGTRYAACDQGTLYMLHDDAKTPVQVACTVPDKNVFALAAGPKGDIFLSTSPRGKVYRLTTAGRLESIYESRGTVTSLALDDAGNLYLGISPTCQVMRISPDGITREIMRGMGRGNRHVQALAFVGGALYAATGPAGGIYRITDPAGQDTEVTAIFAREDLRAGSEDNGATGPESIMVNALAVTKQGQLLAAASTPGQVLQMEPRTEGAFLSSVLQTPVVSRWGQLDIHAKTAAGEGVVVESRSGYTAIPDGTWSAWEPIGADGAELASAPALFAQFRVRMTSTAGSSPILEYARLYYQPVNQAPVVTIQQPKPGIFVSGMKDIRWDAKDPDEDTIISRVFISKTDGATWEPLTPPAKNSEVKPDAKNGGERPEFHAVGEPTKDQSAAKETSARAKNGKNAPAPKPATAEEKPTTTPDATAKDSAPKPTDGEITGNSVPFDTKSMPDGVYRIKVTVSDKYARPTDAKSGEAISGRFIIDNTVPVTPVPDKVYDWNDLKRIEIGDNLTPLVGGKFRIDDGPWIALVAEDGIFNSRKEWVLLIPVNGVESLNTGDHKVTVQAKDSADNVLSRTITLMNSAKPVAKVVIPPLSDGYDDQLAELMLRSLEDQ